MGFHVDLGVDFNVYTGCVVGVGPDSALDFGVEMFKLALNLILLLRLVFYVGYECDSPIGVDVGVDVGF